MPRRKKENNPTAPVRQVLKRSRAKGRGIKQKDLVETSDKANPTEPLQVAPQALPQDVPVAKNSRVQVAPLTAMSSLIQPPPPPDYEFTPAPPSHIYTDEPVTKLYNKDELEQYGITAREVKPTTEEPTLERTYQPTEREKELYPHLYPNNPWDANETKLKSNLGQTMSYGDNPVAIFSDATNRFLNSLSEFFGGLSNPNK